VQNLRFSGDRRRRQHSQIRDRLVTVLNTPTGEFANNKPMRTY
jgi:hypothetical protein